MTLDQTPLTRTIGSEVHGINLTAGMSPDLADALRALLLERAVLVFRGQHPSVEAHLALGTAWGRLAPRHPLYPCVDGHEQIMVIRNDENTPPENESWHSDLSWRANPPFAALLHGVIIPPSGGDTLWCDMRAVHDALSGPMRAMLAGLSAVHSQDYGFSFLRDTDQSDRAAALNAQDRRATTFSHPVIKHHPATARPLVYVNEAFTSHIEGLERRESDALLGMLKGMVNHPRFQLRVRWTPGTLVIWDNWATQHFASADHYPQVREVQRVTVLDDARVGGFDGRPAQAA